MSAASDKSRFYLEKLVPELREYERKEIFSKDEIASITRKRSDFEHKVNARGPHPSDYARYAEYEMNLDTLRRKRIKRLGVKAPMHTGQRRVFFILDRATRRFHGDVSLWMQYIEYARQQRAHKKLSQIFTNALRLHPTHVELWIYAARYSLEDHADMTQARSYMQRGLRFCKSSKSLWVQYAKLEMIYISRIAARQRVLGLDGSRKAGSDNDLVVDDDDPNADVIKMPQITGEDVNPSTENEGVDQAALQNLNNTPALTGAIPIAIFDAGMNHFADDSSLGYDFYTMICEFENTPCFRRVLEHIVDTMITSFPTTSRARICYIRVPVEGVKPHNVQFPQAFAASLSRLKEYSNADSSSLPPDLADEMVKWLRPLARTDDLDPALSRVISSTLASAEKAIGGPLGV